MKVIPLSAWDLAIASSLVFSLALLSVILKLKIEKNVLIAGARMTLQLMLVGLVLKVIFEHVSVFWLTLMALIMLIAAGREVTRRQKRRFTGLWGFGLGTSSMFISAFTITILALLFVIQNKPWYQPQYAIPLLGMMLGNTMNGISLGFDKLTSTAWQQRTIIEGRLMLGQDWSRAIGDIRRECIRGGLIPIINTMSIAGLVSLPGMMTGQILAGNPPIEAVKYQILIMFMIAGGTGLGTVCAVWFGSRRLFDARQRLRLDRLKLNNH